MFSNYHFHTQETDGLICVALDKTFVLKACLLRFFNPFKVMTSLFLLSIYGASYAYPGKGLGVIFCIAVLLRLNICMFMGILSLDEVRRFHGSQPLLQAPTVLYCILQKGSPVTNFVGFLNFFDWAFHTPEPCQYKAKSKNVSLFSVNNKGKMACIEYTEFILWH